MPNDSRVQVLATPSQLSQGFSSKSNWCEGSALWRGSFDPKEKIGRGYAEFTYRLIIDAPAETVYVRFFTSQRRFIITITVVSHFCPTLSNFNAVLSKCAQSGLFCVNSVHCVNTPLNNAIEKDNLVLSTQLIILNYPVILSHRRSTTVFLETYPL